MPTLAELRRQFYGPSQGERPAAIRLTKSECMELLRETNPDLTDVQREDVFINQRPWYIFGVPVAFDDSEG